MLFTVVSVWLMCGSKLTSGVNMSVNFSISLATSLGLFSASPANLNCVVS